MLSQPVYRRVLAGSKIEKFDIVGIHKGKAYPVGSTVIHTDRRGRAWPKQVARSPRGVLIDLVANDLRARTTTIQVSGVLNLPLRDM